MVSILPLERTENGWLTVNQAGNMWLSSNETSAYQWQRRVCLVKQYSVYVVLYYG